MARQNDKSKKTNWWKYILILLLVFVLSSAVGAFFANALVDDKPDYIADNKLVARDKATVMIMGVDKREDDVGRSDTLMVATLDPEKNQASLLSIPRDTRVKIKGHGFDKINAAYAYGGRKLTQETVEALLNTHIDHYISIDIHGFTKIIDALGGIDIDVEKRMYYEDPWDDDGGLYIDLHPGMQHMDGKTAVTYVRYRDEEGDIGRIKRQQKFMKAVMDKLVSPMVIPKLPSIVAAVSDSVETDMSISEILSFLSTLQEAKENGLKSEMVPGKPVYIDDISYWVPDIKKTRQILADSMGIKVSNSINNYNEESDIEYQQSIPDNAVEISDGEHIRNQLENEQRERLRKNRDDIERIERESSHEYDTNRYRENQRDSVSADSRNEERSYQNQEAEEAANSSGSSESSQQNRVAPNINNHNSGKN